MSTTAIVTRYTEPEEYLADLAREVEAGALDRPVLHITKVGKPASGMGTAVMLCAGAIVAGRLTLLERTIGYIYGTAGDVEVNARADATQRRLEEGGASLGLELRAGLLEPRLIGQ